MKKGDLMIVVIVVLVAILGGLYYYITIDREETDAMILIEVDGVEVSREPLYLEGRDEIIAFNGPIGETQVQFLETGAKVLESDCPDKICIHFGMMDRPGHTNACLPNRVVFRIIGGRNTTDINTR